MQTHESIKCFNKNEEHDDAILEMIAVGLNAANKHDDEDEPEIQQVTTQDARI